jgi:hypothetical protein
MNHDTFQDNAFKIRDANSSRFANPVLFKKIRLAWTSSMENLRNTDALIDFYFDSKVNKTQFY